MILSGCDTETYYQEIDGITYKGLKSIQLVTEKEEKYFKIAKQRIELE